MIKRLINKLLAQFGYHLQKYPKPYTKKRKQPDLPGFEVVPFTKQDLDKFEHGG